MMCIVCIVHTRLSWLTNIMCFWLLALYEFVIRIIFRWVTSNESNKSPALLNIQQTLALIKFEKPTNSIQTNLRS